MSRYYLNMPENEPSESFIEEHKDLGFFELIETLKKNNIGWESLLLNLLQIIYLCQLVIKVR